MNRALTWALRLLISFLALAGFMPRPLQLEFLFWLREEMDPQHPAMDTVLAEIASLQDAMRPAQ